MIEVIVWRDSRRRFRRVLVQGHSGLAPAGEDILCAAVSGITQTAALGLGRFAPSARVSTADGRLEMEIGSVESTEPVQVILETMLLGLKDLGRDYPSRIRIREEKA